MPTPDWLNVIDYGADPSGGTECSAKVQDCINAAQNGDRPVYFPQGIYLIGSTLTVGTVAITLLGDGPDISVIRAQNSTGIVLSITTTGSADVKNLGFTSSSPRSSDPYIDSFCYDAHFSRLNFSDYAVGLQSRDLLVVIKDCKFYDGTLQVGVGILVNGWAGGGVIDSVIMPTRSTVVPSDPRTQPAAGIKIVSAGGVQISDCNIIGQGIDLLLSPSGRDQSGQRIGVFDLFAVNSYFDTAYAGLIIAPGDQGVVVRCYFTNCWFSSHGNGAGGAVLESGPNTSTTISSINFTNCIALNNAGSGISASSGADLSVQGGIYSGNAYGIFVNAMNGFTITGASIGAFATDPNTKYGIAIGAGSNNYIVTQNRLVGNASGGISDSGGPNKVVSNNLVY